MERDPNRTQTRENVLATSLVLLVGGMILFFLYVISLGIVGNVLGIGVGFIMLGALHYLIWGRAFSAEVAAEREALQRQQANEEARRTSVSPDAIQDISRTQAIKKNLHV